jgi:hypothetical protein
MSPTIFSILHATALPAGQDFSSSRDILKLEASLPQTVINDLLPALSPLFAMLVSFG